MDPLYDGYILPKLRANPSGLIIYKFRHRNKINLLCSIIPNVEYVVKETTRKIKELAATTRIPLQHIQGRLVNELVHFRLTPKRTKASVLTSST